ncbi:MAG: MBOAT family protein [Phycisphaerales bacterium]|nr:MAG: MBOAT family protein [Phycisphaerales bacterium]
MFGLLAQVGLDATGLDGWFHLTVGQWDPVAGPAGVLLYLPFIPLFWAAGRRATLWLIPISSLMLAWATLGVAYTALLAVITCVCWTVTVTVGSALATTARGPAGQTGAQHTWSTPVVGGCLVLTAIYSLIVIWPQPPWLPKREPPLYFYAQWAGLAYLALRALQVLIEMGRGTVGRAPGLNRERLTEGSAPLTFGRYTAYILFAPSLRMGPIFRYGQFAQELEAAPAQRTGRALAAGAARIALGLFRLGVMLALIGEIPAEQLFSRPESLPTYQLIAGLYIQPLSIFLWIAGYSDIAIGMGRLCGIRVPENFNFPWLATSIADFWRRWHLSLSFWLRDYIYIPLGGNRRHVELNYVITFLFVALWHGLYLSYILWGLSQGVGLAVHRQWSRFWYHRRGLDTKLLRLLRRTGMSGGRPGIVLAWLLTFHYQAFTIALFMDEGHCLTRVGRELLGRLGSS